jgi:hypothetical protein
LQVQNGSFNDGKNDCNPAHHDHNTVQENKKDKVTFRNFGIVGEKCAARRYTAQNPSHTPQLPIANARRPSFSWAVLDWKSSPPRDCKPTGDARTTKTIGVCDATTLAEVPRGPVSFDETHNAVANDYFNQVKNMDGVHRTVCFPMAEQAALLLRQTEGRKDELVALITSIEPSRLDATDWLRLNRDHWALRAVCISAWISPTTTTSAGCVTTTRCWCSP